jgi:hypothetical protein
MDGLRQEKILITATYLMIVRFLLSKLSRVAMEIQSTSKKWIAFPACGHATSPKLNKTTKGLIKRSLPYLSSAVDLSSFRQGG